MSEFLIKLYESKHAGKTGAREGLGSFAGLIGLGCNILLFAFKLLVGVLSASVSIVADAVNNLSDAGASVMTLIGFKLSKKPADKEHPYGHARVEYMAGMFIAVLIILVGASLLRSSIEKVITPSPVAFSAATFVVLGGSVLVKLWMMLFYSKTAKHINSTALLASMEDSRNDVIATLAVAVGALVQYFTGVEVDGFVGAAVAVFILISGISLIGDTMSPLLGEAPTKELVDSLRELIMSYEGVIGMHDLMIHSYGPSNRFATAHVEMSADGDPMYLHGVLDNIEREAENKLGVKLCIHLDPVAPASEKDADAAKQLIDYVGELDSTLSIHDLRVVKTHDHINFIFDVAVPSEYKGDTDALREKLEARVVEIDPSYYPVIEIDRNYNM